LQRPRDQSRDAFGERGQDSGQIGIGGPVPGEVGLSEPDASFYSQPAEECVRSFESQHGSTGTTTAEAFSVRELDDQIQPAHGMPEQPLGEAGSQR
jgi:hypothetical protein